MKVEFPTDVSDPRRLAGFADAIFVGRVRNTWQATELDGTPWRSATVSVVESLKGAVAGELIVEQQGGLNQEGKLFIVENDEQIEAGREYLFATRESSRGSFVLVPVHGDVKLGTDRAQILDSMRVAIAKQIPFP